MWRLYRSISRAMTHHFLTFLDPIGEIFRVVLLVKKRDVRVAVATFIYNLAFPQLKVSSIQVNVFVVFSLREGFLLIHIFLQGSIASHWRITILILRNLF